MMRFYFGSRYFEKWQKLLDKKIAFLINKGLSRIEANKFYSEIPTLFTRRNVKDFYAEILSLEKTSQLHGFDEYTHHKKFGQFRPDHIFENDNIAYEVSTLTWRSEEQQKIQSLIIALEHRYRRLGYSTQIIYGPDILTMTRNRIPSGTVMKSLTEMLIYPVTEINNIAKKIWSKISEAKRQLTSFPGCKVVILNLEDSYYDAKKTIQVLKNNIGNTKKLDAVLLMVMGSDGKQTLIPIIRPKSPLSTSYFSKITFPIPYFPQAVWSMPTIFKAKRGIVHMLEKDKHGFWSSDDVLIGKSLIENTLAIQGFLGMPKNLGWIEVHRSSSVS